jgi:hypothetical protein
MAHTEAGQREGAAGAWVQRVQRVQRVQSVGAANAANVRVSRGRVGVGVLPAQSGAFVKVETWISEMGKIAGMLRS